MTRLSTSGLALAATSLFSGIASAVQPLTVEGSNFVTNSTGDRFSIIGVDYQPGGSSGLTSTSDPLSDPTTCLRDAILMQQLGVNTIRVYNLDVDLNHDECVSIFNAAGIYMILDVNAGSYGTYIDRSNPSSTYTIDYLKHIFGIVEAFAHYPNLIGFFSGNEIINEDSSYDAPLYIRAVTRDLKDYIAHNIERSVPVGYSAADVDTMLTDTWNYLGCELSNSTSSKIDFFGLNDYEWCGDSSYTKAGYDKLTAMFEDTSIPVFFSEYGCNNVKPRTFTEVGALYGDQMTVLSGGLVYEWSEDSNDYGLVDINSTKEVTLREDYAYLKKEFAKIDVDSITKVNATAESQSASKCKAAMITESAFYNSWGLPDRPSGGDALVSSGLASANKGTTVKVTSTSIAATVINTAGASSTGLTLNVLDDDAYNYPGRTGTSDSGTSGGASTGSQDKVSSNAAKSSASAASSASSASSSASSSSSTATSGASTVMAFQAAAVTVGALALLFVF